MPMAATGRRASSSFCNTRRAVDSTVSQITSGSCSTQPDWGEVCAKLCCSAVRAAPAPEKAMARVELVPWSIASKASSAGILGVSPLAGREELGVAEDAILAQFHDIDEFGGDGDAGDFGIDVGAPVRGGPRPFDHQRQQGVVGETEYLDHHGQPRLELGQPVRADRDRLVGAGADDFEPALVCKQPAQSGEVAADTRRMQLPNDAFRNDALRHCSLLCQANAALISPPICVNAVRAYGITAPRP